MRCYHLLVPIYLFLIFLLSESPSVSAQSGNLLQDGGFDGFYNQGDGSSGPWKPFRLSDHTFGIFKHITEGWPKGPSAWIYGDAIPFDGGIYQTVGVSPGRGYNFNIAWAVVRHNGVGVSSDAKLVRLIGIDPFGGIDARSANIVWSGEYRGSGKFPPELNVDAYARADKITVFLRARNEYPNSRAEVFFDTAALQENGAPPLALTPATATPAPATLTRAISSTPLRTRVASAATATAIPTATPASAETREPTRTRTPRPTEIPQPASSLADFALPLALAGCLFAGVVGLGGVGLILLAKRN